MKLFIEFVSHVVVIWCSFKIGGKFGSDCGWLTYLVLSALQNVRFRVAEMAPVWEAQLAEHAAKKSSPPSI